MQIDLNCAKMRFSFNNGKLKILLQYCVLKELLNLACIARSAQPIADERLSAFAVVVVVDQSARGYFYLPCMSYRTRME